MNIKFSSLSLVKAFAAVATAVVLFVSNPVTALANGNDNKKVEKVAEDAVTVDFIGTNDNSFVFRVQFENTTGQKFWLIVKNDAGEVVYQEQFNDVHFAKAVHIAKEEVEIHPTFVIRTGNQQIERSFSVSRKVTEKVEVTKL